MTGGPPSVRRADGTFDHTGSGVLASGLEASGYKWKQFEPGHTVNLRHGASHSGTVRPIADRLAKGLAEVAPWTAAAAFASTVAAWSWAEAQCSLYRAWFDEHGLLNEDGEPRPGLGRWDRAETRAATLRGELGLTPQSLGQLLARAASVASATNDEQALEALRAEGSRILAARAVRETRPASVALAERSVDRG